MAIEDGRMKYLRVKNWEKHQHYTDRNPPWIKFYTALLDIAKEPEYSALSDGAKLTLHHIWLLAGITDNQIPDAMLNRNHLNMKGNPSIKELVDASLVAFDVASTSASGDASKDASNVAKKSLCNSVSLNSVSLFDRDTEFESLWAEYPKGIGKKAARKHFDASVLWADDLGAIKTALANYKAATANTDPKFIQHGSTWFNNWRDWKRDPTAPPPAKLQPASEPEEMSLHEGLQYLAHGGRGVYAFILEYGDPDTSEALRAKFNNEFWDRFADGTRNQWERWKELCAEEGVEPKPIQKVRA